MSEPVKTFSIGFEGDAAYDETAYARLAAERFKTDHTEFQVAPSAVDLIDTLIWHHDGPFGDSSAVPTYIVSKLTREQVTVVLTGDGGDELFAGYMRFYAALHVGADSAVRGGGRRRRRCRRADPCAAIATGWPAPSDSRARSAVRSTSGSRAGTRCSSTICSSCCGPTSSPGSPRSSACCACPTSVR